MRRHSCLTFTVAFLQNRLTPSPSFMKSFLQMCAMIPVAKASPITFTMVRNLSLHRRKVCGMFWNKEEIRTKALTCSCSSVVSLELSHIMIMGVNTFATYSAQSTAMMSVMSSVGNPTDVSTITMVTSPACGIPAAPMLAAVAVMLREI